MITLIGTGHVFDLATALLSIFDEKEPDVICVELDKQRYHALMMKRSDPESSESARKDLPFVYKLLGRFQESIASEYGVNAGDEMLTAINYAQSHQLPIEFIDVNAQQLFTKMWRSMPFSERFKLLFSGFGAFFVSKKRVEKELKNLQNDFDSYIEEIGKKFPTIKKTLIDDRNEYMVKKLVTLQESHQKIVACVGDGHIPGMSKLLESKKIEFETIRLAELRNKKQVDVGSGSAHFSIDYKPM